MDRTMRPVSQRARERLREVQRREAQALTAVERAAARRDRAVTRLEAAQIAPQRRLDQAETQLSRARAALAGVSGVERAATLLAESPARVRADVRAAKAVSATTSAPASDSSAGGERRPADVDDDGS